MMNWIMQCSVLASPPFRDPIALKLHWPIPGVGASPPLVPDLAYRRYANSTRNGTEGIPEIRLGNTAEGREGARGLSGHVGYLCAELALAFHGRGAGGPAGMLEVHVQFDIKIAFGKYRRLCLRTHLRRALSYIP